MIQLLLYHQIPVHMSQQEEELSHPFENVHASFPHPDYQGKPQKHCYRSEWPEPQWYVCRFQVLNHHKEVIQMMENSYKVFGISEADVNTFAEKLKISNLD